MLPLVVGIIFIILGFGMLCLSGYVFPYVNNYMYPITHTYLISQETIKYAPLIGLVLILIGIAFLLWFFKK